MNTVRLILDIGFFYISHTNVQANSKHVMIGFSVT